MSNGSPSSRILGSLAALGMMVFSALTVRHFFQANYPTSIFEGSFCDLNAFFNCDSSAYSNISAVVGVPLGWFGMALGALVGIGALFPSAPLERTNRTLAAVNVVGVLALLGYSVLVLKSLCLLCSGYYLSSFLTLGVHWPRRGGDRDLADPSWFRPALLHLAAFGAFTLLGAWGIAQYHGARREAQSGGVAARVVGQFYSLPEVPWPSRISPLWSVRSTEAFDDAPVRVVEFGDPLCVDCRVLNEQLERLAEEFEGRLNVAFQFFPLEAACNDVVDKDKHPGACRLSAFLAAGGESFPEMLHQVFREMREAKEPSWQDAFARRWGVDGADADAPTVELVRHLIQTGREYSRTDERYPYGIRSTPTMIINNRMIIGTLPYDQLRAIFRALVDEHDRDAAAFIESWEPTGY